MFDRRHFFGTALGALALPFIVRSASAQSPEFVFKLHHFLGPKAPAQTKMLEPWSKKIEEDSNGRIKIEIYPSMSLGGAPPQLIRQVTDGVVDIVWTVNGYTPNLFPRSEAFRIALGVDAGSGPRRIEFRVVDALSFALRLAAEPPIEREQVACVEVGRELTQPVFDAGRREPR